LQYAQFSEWRRSLRGEPEAEEGRERWRRQVLLADGAPALPGDAPALAKRRGEIATHTLTLTRDEAERVESAARRLATTRETVLFSAWLTLLGRLTGWPALVAAAVCDGRDYEPLRDACGLFAVSLPVRCEFIEGLRFGEVVAQVEKSLRDGSEWQDYFDWDEIGAGERPAYFTFGFERARRPAAVVVADLRLSVIHQRCYADRFSIKLYCVETDDAIEVEFQYDTNWRRAEDIRPLSGQFRTLLAAAAADANAPVAALEFLGEEERRQVLYEWNRTRRDYPVDLCLHQLFERQAECAPDRVAAVFKDERITYSELNRRANQLARYLRARGAGPDTPVGLRVGRSLEMLTGLLGILKAGGAYLPLDPIHPREYVAQTLKDAGAGMLLTERDLAPSPEEFQGNKDDLESASATEPALRLIRLDADWTEIAREGDSNQPAAATPGNLAYVIYTSGSTGRPKGVMIESRSVANLAAALREELYADLGDAPLRVGINAPLVFDASVKQIVQLLDGHTLYPLPEELRLDAPGLVSYLDTHALDALDCTPSQLKLLLDAGLTTRPARPPRLMLVGGEPLDESTWAKLVGQERTRFQNVYGPTECAVDATWIEAREAPDGPTIGRPIPNAQAYVLDRDLGPVAVLMTGEIYVGGHGVARGYLNRPELTAERFVPDEYGGALGARLYQTGDLARHASTGEIVFIGRNDLQVKIRGYRVEIEEIESALEGHERVRAAAVAARADDAGETRLVAYIVVDKGVAAPTAGELRRRLTERLPEYMSPSIFVILDDLPLTRNGKLDRRALPSPQGRRSAERGDYVAPGNEIERVIAGIWQEVLRGERFGVDDNFFDAGGHSLLMVQVHSRLREALGKDLPIVEMFKRPTIKALAAYFSGGEGQGPDFRQVRARAERRKQAGYHRRRV
jgi:amino acid adenylation domain-containing protein